MLNVEWIKNMVDKTCTEEGEAVTIEEKLNNVPSTNHAIAGDNENALVLETPNPSDHEEGEIDDDEDTGDGGNDVLMYEDISSEEDVIRERLAQLEAMDTELRLIDGIACEDTYGKYSASNKNPLLDDHPTESYECISDEEYVELYLPPHEPLPRPKLLPARRKQRRTPLRSESQSQCHTVRRHGSNRSKRKLERKKRDQTARKIMLNRRRKRRKQQLNLLTVNVDESSDSEKDFPLDRARLQAACTITNRKRKTDKENWDALKQKLQLQKRRKEQESIKDVEILLDETVVIEDDDHDDEDEEVLQLRLQALKSKAEIKETEDSNTIRQSPEKQAEELELRMIALKSTFTNKAQLRHKKTLEERPYSPSDEIRVLLSPIPSSIDALPNVEDDDDVLIIESRPETVEITDSSDEENHMEISPSSSPQCPEAPDIRPIDMDVATSSESRSPLLGTVTDPQLSGDNSIEMEVSSASSINQVETGLVDEDDEETLRHQLLSKMAGTNTTQNNVAIPQRSVTPDSVSEEEAEALRQLILSKMTSKKTSQKQEKSNITTVELEHHSQTDNHIPQDESILPPSNPQESTREALVNNFEDEPSNTLTFTPLPALTKPVPHSNLITLIGKQKIIRKAKRKQSVSSAIPAKRSVTPLAITLPLPSRTFVKTSAAKTNQYQTTSKPLTVTKLVNNPNKLINLNPPTLHSPKQRSNIVETFVQKPVQKLIIQVGNSDSDSDPEYYPLSEPLVNTQETDKQLDDALLRDLDNVSPSRVTLESPRYSPTPMHKPEGPVESQIIASQAAFEERLDQFLKTVRNKIDQRQQQSNLSAGNNLNGLGTVERAGTNVGYTSTIAAPITPVAVRHLSEKSQQEYKLLVARMAHLEKIKQQRTQRQAALRKTGASITKTIINNCASESGTQKTHDLVVTVNQDRRDVVDKTAAGTAITPRKNQSQSTKRDSDPLLKRVLVNNTVLAEAKNQTATCSIPKECTKEDCDKQNPVNTNLSVNISPAKKSIDKRLVPNFNSDQDVTILRDALKRLAVIKEEKARQNELLAAEQHYEMYSLRYRKDLQDLIGTLRHTQEQRTKQYDLENKIAFLKEKLAVLERVAANHQKKMASIFPTLQESHARAMNSRKKSNEITKLCMAIGRKVKGEKYGLPSTIRNEIHEQINILAVETKELKNMKKLSLDEFKQISLEERKKLLEKQVEQHQLQKLVAPEEIKTDASSPDKVPINSHFPLAEENTSEVNSCEKASRLPVIAIPCDSKQYAKSAPTSRSTSPAIALLAHEHPSAVAKEAPAALSCEPPVRFAKYTSPLASLQDQSALNIPDGVICPYQMRGECIDQECKFEHFK